MATVVFQIILAAGGKVDGNFRLAVGGLWEPKPLRPQPGGEEEALAGRAWRGLDMECVMEGLRGASTPEQTSGEICCWGPGLDGGRGVGGAGLTGLKHLKSTWVLREGPAKPLPGAPTYFLPTGQGTLVVKPYISDRVEVSGQWRLPGA